jgi:hypothetical protein
VGCSLMDDAVPIIDNVTINQPAAAIELNQ